MKNENPVFRENPKFQQYTGRMHRPDMFIPNTHVFYDSVNGRLVDDPNSITPKASFAITELKEVEPGIFEPVE